MLTTTLLSDAQRQTLRQTGSPGAAPVSEDTFARISSGLKKHAPLRMAGGATGASARSDSNTKADFQDACGAAADAVAHLRDPLASNMTAAIADLFSGQAAGAAALREYWLSLGYSASEVDCYLTQATKAPDGFAEVAGMILQSDGWSEAVANFGAGDRDPSQWGFGLSTGADVNPLTATFVTTARKAGITPSLFLLVSVALLADKIRSEVGTR